MIRIAGSVSKGWLARELGVVFDRSYYFDPIERQAIDARCNDYLRETLGDLALFHTEANLGRLEYYRPEQALVGGIQPNMILGMLLGADFLPAADRDADISVRCLDGVDRSALPAPETLLSHELVRQFDAQLQAARTAGLRPIPPFFWDASGRPAVHGPLTSALKFLGDDFLVQIVTQPERSSDLMRWLTDVSIMLVRHYAELGDLAVTGIHVGECSACMVRADLFARLIVPVLARYGEALGPVRLHSCGRSDHLLEACRAITNLQSLDVGGETSVARIRENFGRDFPVGIAPLVEHMSAASPRGILQWFERVQQDNAGGDLTVGYHLEASYELKTIRALHRAIDTANACSPAGVD